MLGERRLASLAREAGIPWAEVGVREFPAASNWHLYRRIDSPGPGYQYNTKLGVDLKFKMMNILRDSWVTNLLETRSVPFWTR